VFFLTHLGFITGEQRRNDTDSLQNRTCEMKRENTRQISFQRIPGAATAPVTQQWVLALLGPSPRPPIDAKCAHDCSNQGRLITRLSEKGPTWLQKANDIKCLPTGITCAFFLLSTEDLRAIITFAEMLIAKGSSIHGASPITSWSRKATLSVHTSFPRQPSLQTISQRHLGESNVPCGSNGEQEFLVRSRRLVTSKLDTEKKQGQESDDVILSSANLLHKCITLEAVDEIDDSW
jgi:hypothetical protein